MKVNKNRIIFFISIIIYLISLSQKSYCSSFGICENIGILSLIFGWVGVFMLHIPAFTWLANPALFLSWFFYKKKPLISFLFNVLSILLMLSFLMVDEIINNEAGTKSKVIFYGLGYWLWVLSSFILLIGNIMFLKYKNELHIK